jgi:hypothetical protein
LVTPPVPEVTQPLTQIVPVKDPTSDAKRSSTQAGALRDMKAVRVREGEARVQLGGAARTLRAGDAIGTDVVRRVDDDRIVLARPESSGAESTVIVTFDAQGKARVRVYTTQDPTAPNAPPVR